jgi:hypothetical protein
LDGSDNVIYLTIFGIMMMLLFIAHVCWTIA